MSAVSVFLVVVFAACIATVVTVVVDEMVENRKRWQRADRPNRRP